MINRLFVLGLLITSCNLSYADEIQSLSILKNKIEEHVLMELSQQYEGRIHITANHPDSRIQLRTCPEEQLTVFNPYHSSLLGSFTMGIRCEDNNNHWALYIPTKTRLEKSVLLAKHPINKGKKIMAEDLYIGEIDVSRLKGYFSEPSQVIGQVARQTINDGAYLTPQMIEKPVLIHKGARITIQAINKQVKITMTGIALSDGSLNDVIQVKNLSSKKIIEGEITETNQVTVNFS